MRLESRIEAFLARLLRLSGMPDKLRTRKVHRAALRVEIFALITLIAFGLLQLAILIVHAILRILQGLYLLHGYIPSAFGGIIAMTAPFVLLVPAYLILYPWAKRLVIGRRLAERRLHGRCIACGQDLRGINPERCPECGLFLASLRESTVNQSEPRS